MSAQELTSAYMVSALQATQHAGSKIEFFNALKTALRKRLDLADAALTTSVAKTAATDDNSNVREAAQQTLGVIVEKRPDLADAALSVAKTAATDGDSVVREAALRTLGMIVEKRPELADAALSVAKTAAPKLGRPALNNSTRALLDLVS